MARVLGDVVPRPGTILVANQRISYRAIKPGTRGRVAVEVNVLNEGKTAWTPEGASLVGPARQCLTGLTLWSLDPIPPGSMGRLVVEVDATESESRGPFTLKLWDEQGHAGVVLEGVTLP